MLKLASVLLIFSSLAANASETSTAMPVVKDSTKTEYIDHPLEAQGLVRITSDKTYIYKLENASQKNSVSLRFAPYEPKNLANPENGTTFSENYENGNFPLVLFDYEWQLWRTAVGRFGFKIGSGLYMANGHGRFKNPQENPNHTTPMESFSLFMFPNSAGVTYRFQLRDRPFFVPYVEGGGVAYTFTELRDDSRGPKFGAAAGAYGVAGGALNLRWLDVKSALALDREYGVSSVYLTGEVRAMLSTTKYDFSSTTFAAGFLFDF